MTARVSDRVRERAVGKLQRGYACGALETQTFERRLDVALAALSPRVLDRVTWDLEPSLIDRLRARFGRPFPTAQSPGVLHGLVGPGPTVIGRSRSCDLVLASDSVSRRHAQITADEKRMVVTDLGSTNGTYLNGRWVAQAEVHRGDHLQLGEVELWL